MLYLIVYYNLPDVPSNPMLQQFRSGATVSDNYYERIRIRGVGPVAS